MPANRSTLIAVLMLGLAACQAQPQPQSQLPTALPTQARQREPSEAAAPSQAPTVMPTAAPQPTTEPTETEAFHMAFADSSWDGELIPDGQKCINPNPATPALLVKNIPEGADAIILEFSDKDYGPMDDGGHGKLGFTIDPGTEQVLIPSIPGNTFDLPEAFFLVEEHGAGTVFTPGAYMPPCSGGRDHRYYVTGKAVAVLSLTELSFDVLDETVLQLGEY